MKNSGVISQHKTLAMTGKPYPGNKKTVTAFAKGGKAAPYEGTAKDMREDKILAKKHKMSMKQWEASKMDEKHDRQRSMKGLKRGGKAC